MAMNADRSRIVLDLFEKFYGRVYCFARRSVSSEIAEDIAQDVFIRLLERENLENMEISVSYLLKIADNLMKRRWQREQRFGKYQDRIRSEQQGAFATTRAHASVIMNDEQARAALSTLPDNERAAVELIVCNELSYEEAAESLGVRVTTVNNWKYRGLQKLKNVSTQFEPDAATQSCTDSRHRADAAGSRPKQSARKGSSDSACEQAYLHPEHPSFRNRVNSAANAEYRRAHRSFA